ncbi:camp-dependent protein kinase-like protein regulatory subunit [Viridothelium virens]|uniref:cAMP-dependent protein kinase regulatory subunit n=1 Tax=Viridothelium virens TaxID=1048519 RepID=A0A6A6H959_VIRVR|nr:camp-dependent protein kinase-like protein regulatory subunit [Viridothelium virens]
MSLPSDLPPDYANEINSLSREIKNAQPTDVLQFCANFFLRRLESQRAEFLLARHHTSASKGGAMAESNFPGNNPFSGGSVGSTALGSAAGAERGMHRLEEEDEGDMFASPTASSFPPNAMNRSHNASSVSPSASPPSDNQSFPNNYNMNRRTSVSAESLNPTSSNDNFTPPHHAKTAEQQARLRAAVAHNFLFSHLDDEQSAQVLGALQEKAIPAKGIKVITQGDEGDYFYVVERGSFAIYVNPSGRLESGTEGLGNKVGECGPGGSFGELALMYNAPRAATVVSQEPSTLWALDRITFRRILMDSAFARRRMYENFLEEVPLLASLTPYERSKIADALETHKYPPGSTIIKEGDAGESFFILEAGEAEVFKRSSGGRPVHKYKKGDYFGELALLNDAPRAASVVSATEVKVATLGKDGFQRLLGPVEGIMRRNDPSKREYDGVAPDDSDVDPLAQGR